MTENFIRLKQTFLNGIPNRLARINALTAACIGQGSAFQADNIDQLHRELHKLSGAAACYQCHEIGSAAEACESWLEAYMIHDTPLTEHTSLQFLEKLETLKQMCVAASA